MKAEPAVAVLSGATALGATMLLGGIAYLLPFAVTFAVLGLFIARQIRAESKQPASRHVVTTDDRSAGSSNRAR